MKTAQAKSGIKWDSYLATAYAEGFCEGEDATPLEQLEAWAYLIKTGTCWHLQGFFGRTAQSLIDDGIISRAGDITEQGYNAIEGSL